MAIVDELSEHYRAAVQRAVPEELVLAAGVFTDASGQDVALGAGTERLVVVSFRPAGLEIEVGAVLAAWPRRTTGLALRERSSARVLVLRHGPAMGDGGEVTELRSPRQLGRFDRVNDPLYRQLAVEVSRAPGS